MTTSPRPGPPSEWVSDKVDLDELFRDAKPIGDVALNTTDFEDYAEREGLRLITPSSH